MSRKRQLSLLLLLFLSMIGTLAWYIFAQITQVIRAESGQTLVIKPGTGIAQLSHQLARDGIVTTPLDVRLAAIFYQLHNPKTRIQAGHYRLDDVTSLDQLFDIIHAGRVVQKTFTIIPGWNKWQLIDMLVKNRLICDASLPLSVSERETIEARLLTQFAPEHASIEGLFLADSYYYTKDCDLAPLRLARTALVNMLKKAWGKRQSDLPLENAYQALTLASIIEKETGVASERPIIAAVFLNRLRKKMRLQTDPTVIYGLGDAYQGNITSAHLRKKTAYNTYVIRGLPPTPISMVSAAALRSVFASAASDYLYFVGKGDGSHQFSRSYRDHRRAVTKYQIRRTKNYRSSPPTTTTTPLSPTTAPATNQ